MRDSATFAVVEFSRSARWCERRWRKEFVGAAGLIVGACLAAVRTLSHARSRPVYASTEHRDELEIVFVNRDVLRKSLKMHFASPIMHHDAYVVSHVREVM